MDMDGCGVNRQGAAKMGGGGKAWTQGKPRTPPRTPVQPEKPKPKPATAEEVWKFLLQTVEK